MVCFKAGINNKGKALLLCRQELCGGNQYLGGKDDGEGRISEILAERIFYSIAVVRVRL